MMASALYLGTVMHNRVKPVRHQFSYTVFSVLIDLDEVAGLGLRSLRHNRFGLLSFHDRDHGPGDGSPLKPWIAARLAEAGIVADGPVRILCFPRVLGFVFNPLSVWFCHAADGTLAATVHEVSNTFGQKHFYIIPAQVEADGLIHQDCAKAFYVSPFMPMATDYHFRILPPGERVSVIIRQTDAEGTVFHASLAGRRVPLTDRALLGAFFRHPLMTLKVVAGIHLEALRLWRKGMTLQPRPETLP
ncbi:MAG: hypothetical protein VR70_11395 [Rhodospirillaceae bacterium BRH_c57]|nr:MAG: hypothetical protein VR70_11395 [Rhodospirillaceae bacterium BRH_c57]